VIAAQPFPLLFATIGGSHIYGFASPDSDWDVRGVHVLPLKSVLGLSTSRETIEKLEKRDDFELDLVTHDVKKFLGLLLKKNGYVLEQLYSPLVLATSPEHVELKAIARGCVTKHHANHYLGFARTEWQQFVRATPRIAKQLLYVLRVLLTGIHLVRTGEVEPDLRKLASAEKLGYVDELIAMKLAGRFAGEIADERFPFFEAEVDRLRAKLEAEYAASHLRDGVSLETKAALDDLLVRARMKTCST
jgi:predicted nucleotidyltransferase